MGDFLCAERSVCVPFRQKLQRRPIGRLFFCKNIFVNFRKNIDFFAFFLYICTIPIRGRCVRTPNYTYRLERGCIIGKKRGDY